MDWSKMAKTSWLSRLAQTLFFVGIVFLLTYRLVDTPPGLTVDEASFGYNGVLLSRTGYDENGKFMPLFVSSIKGQDWRQPITQYFVATFFKIIPPSSFTLRLTSVFIALLSSLLIFKLSSKIFSKFTSYLSVIIFIFTPIVFIQSHMALDNIMPIPFVVLWLSLIYQYRAKKKLGYLFLAGVSLGLSLYAYKAMRIIVPPLVGTTILYLCLESKWKIKKVFYGLAPFLSGVLPFFAVMPYLKTLYPGAVSGGYVFHFMAWDNFFLPIISAFDLSFLFIKGDALLYHSTGIHGMFLLATLPLFIIGAYQSIQKNNFWIFVLASFFAVPLMFGLINSVYRASRFLAMVPSFILICSLGVEYLLKNSKTSRYILGLITVLLFINFSNFAYYYWFKYPKRYIGEYNQTEDETYRIFSKEAKSRNLTPYIEEDIYTSDGEVSHFLEAAYFSQKLGKIKSNEEAPESSILLSNRDKIPNMSLLDISIPNFHLHVRK